MNNNASPEVSVLIPHYDQPAALKKCLESLERQTFPPEKTEIIVADNGTPGGICELERRFPQMRFVSACKKGAANARNEAMRHARGRVFAFIDADCVAAPDWLSRGVEGLTKSELSGGAIAVSVEIEGAPSAVEAFERVFAFHQRDYVERKKFSATANLFVRREAALAIGPFTNGLSEDVDWCRRAAALGFHLAFNPNSVVSHPARRNWSELVRKWERLIAERWAGFGRKDAFGVLGWMSLAAATALSVGPHLLLVATSAELKTARDKMAAAGVLARIRLWRAWRMAALAATK